MTERRPAGAQPGAPPAGPDAPGGGINPLAIVLQMGVMYFMYQSMSNRNAAAPVAAPTAAPGAFDALGGAAGASSSSASLSSPASAPTAAPQAPQLPGWFPSEMKDMMEVAVKSQSGKRTVPSALSYWEDARMSKLTSTKATRLVNTWRPGHRFDILVYLSESAQPITYFATELNQQDFAAPLPEEEGGWYAPALASSASTNGNSSGGVTAQWSLMGGAMSRWTSQASFKLGATNPPARVRRNDTFTGLLRVDTSGSGSSSSGSGEGQGEDPASDQAAPGVHAPPLFWRVRDMTFGYEEENNVEQALSIALPPRVTANRTCVYAHIFLVTQGYPVDPKSFGYERTKVAGWIHPLVRLLAKKPEKVTFNLLSGEGGEKDASGKVKNPEARFGIGLPTAEEEKEAQEKQEKEQQGQEDPAAVATVDLTADGQQVPDLMEGEPHITHASHSTSTDDSEAGKGGKGSKGSKGKVMPILPYWKPSLSIETVVDYSVYAPNQLPPNVKSVIQIERLPGTPPVSSRAAAGGAPAADAAVTEAYLPLLHVNDFWTLGHHLVPLNESVTTVPLTVKFGPAPLWRWALQSQMSATWEVQQGMGTSGEGESDMLKSIIMDTNPVLLGITMAVSMLHMVFDFLAFRNDISFWRSAKSLEGVSVRTLTLSLVQQVIIAAYLFNENTSWMILISQVMGLGIEFWKLRKAVAVNMSWKRAKVAGLSIPYPSIDFSDKEESYANSRTKEYDDIATAHLLFILYPLVAGYALYSLFYDRHRSWLSWLLGSLTGFVYTFGFAQMVPQLYINYRLKSVAHMPWRAMVYKALNTFIDDLFAFVVKMPTLHRLSVFRDDIIFFCYLYQRWIYPIDKARKNEYGASALDYEAQEARAKGEVRKPRRGKMERRAPVA